MFADWMIRLLQIAETYRDEGASTVFRKSLVAKETAVKTRMVLHRLRTGPAKGGESDMACVEVCRERLDAKELRYHVRSRHLKAKRNLLIGYKGFALTRTGDVIGDIWYVENTGGSAGRIHPDLTWLDLHLAADDVYMFDMYLMKEHRGGGTARVLLIGALQQLKEKGYRRAYGYYVTHNIPALWMHRMLGYEELSRIEVRRRLGRYRRIGGEQVAERRIS